MADQVSWMQGLRLYTASCALLLYSYYQPCHARWVTWVTWVTWVAAQPCSDWCGAANLPEPVGCLLGSMDKESSEFKNAAKDAARTIPGREHGGNCDIKNLTKGCKVWLPPFPPTPLLQQLLVQLLPLHGLLYQVLGFKYAEWLHLYSDPESLAKGSKTCSLAFDL